MSPSFELEQRMAALQASLRPRRAHIHTAL
jgi:hypothetical protein